MEIDNKPTVTREPAEPLAREDSSTQSWDRIADDWVAHADSNDYRNLFLLPLTLEMLGDVRELRILDVGCGEGGYTRELARRGARCTGVDGSLRLVETARKRAVSDNLQIEYHLANASSLTQLGPASFDLVLSAMVLMDVEDYEAAVVEALRVLVPGGELLMSITHPCFSPAVSEWVVDEHGHPLYFAVDRYFDRAAWEDMLSRSFTSPVLRRHRPLEDYIGALLRTGFVLRDFREPTATREDVSKSARFEHLTRIPYFLFMRWMKPQES